jgi:hypothetical protein
MVRRLSLATPTSTASTADDAAPPSCAAPAAIKALHNIMFRSPLAPLARCCASELGPGPGRSARSGPRLAANRGGLGGAPRRAGPALGRPPRACTDAPGLSIARLS